MLIFLILLTIKKRAIIIGPEYQLADFYNSTHENGINKWMMKGKTYILSHLINLPFCVIAHVPRIGKNYEWKIDEHKYGKSLNKDAVFPEFGFVISITFKFIKA